MKRLVLILCLVASTAWAQQQEESSSEIVINLNRDWSSLANAMRHAAASVTAMTQERTALETKVKELEAKVKELEAKLKAATEKKDGGV